MVTPMTSHAGQLQEGSVGGQAKGWDSAAVHLCQESHQWVSWVLILLWRIWSNGQEQQRAGPEPKDVKNMAQPELGAVLSWNGSWAVCGGCRWGWLWRLRTGCSRSLDNASDKYPHRSRPGLTWRAVLFAAFAHCYRAQARYRKQSGLIFFNCYSRNNLECFNIRLLARYLLQSFCGCVLWLVWLWHQLLPQWCCPFSAPV